MVFLSKVFYLQRFIAFAKEGGTNWVAFVSLSSLLERLYKNYKIDFDKIESVVKLSSQEEPINIQCELVDHFIISLYYNHNNFIIRVSDCFISIIQQIEYST